MRTIAPEAAFQIVLKNHSKEVRRKVNIYVYLVKGEVHATKSTHFTDISCWSPEGYC